MNVKEELTRTIRIFPLVIVLFFSALLIGYTIIQNRAKVDFLKSSLQQEFLEGQKERVLSQILQLEMQGQNQNKALYQAVETRVKNRLREARNIVEDVYNANNDKPVEEITARIVDVLKEKQQDSSGRNEHFFICTIGGIGVLWPASPDLEGKDLLDIQDPKGTYFIREFIARNERKSQEMLVWWEPRPGGPVDVSWQKMGNVFYFAPCELIIGTGEYIDSFREKVEQKSLEWIEQVYAPEFNRVLVFDRTDRILFSRGIANAKVGSFVTSLDCSIDGQPLRFSTVKEMPQKGSFVSLSCQNERWDGGEFHVRSFADWQWGIVSSIDGEEVVSSSFLDKTTIIRQQNIINLFIIFLCCLGLVALVGWGIVIVGRKVNQYVSEKLVYDELTGLPKRSFFSLQVDSCLEKGNAVAVINLDIDNFNGINERFSREAGNLLLRQISDRLLSIIPKDQLCHAESDEFLVFLPGIQGGDDGCCAAVAKVNELRALFIQPFFLEDSQMELCFSSGCCCSDIAHASAMELIRQASITLFRMKGEGRDRHGCYSQLQGQVKRDRQLVDALPGAIERNELSLLYQPLVTGHGKSVFRLDTIIQWNHPELGRIPLQDFISIAEKNDLVLALGTFLIKKVCVDIRSLEQRGVGSPVVSINISSRQVFESRYVKSILNVIDEMGVDRSRITLGLRETLLDRGIEKVLPALEILKNEGIELFLDEFGTGSSSLHNISRLPLTELKIDKSLVAGLPADRHCVALVRSVMSVAAAREMSVVANGVETKAQVEWLTAAGCDLMQGTYYSAPMKRDELSGYYGGSRISFI